MDRETAIESGTNRVRAKLYNRPILVVMNTNSTYGIYSLVVTGNVMCGLPTG